MIRMDIRMDESIVRFISRLNLEGTRVDPGFGAPSRGDATRQRGRALVNWEVPASIVMASTLGSDGLQPNVASCYGWWQPEWHGRRRQWQSWTHPLDGGAEPRIAGVFRPSTA